MSLGVAGPQPLTVRMAPPNVGPWGDDFHSNTALGFTQSESTPEVFKSLLHSHRVLGSWPSTPSHPAALVKEGGVGPKILLRCHFR